MQKWYTYYYKRTFENAFKLVFKSIELPRSSCNKARRIVAFIFKGEKMRQISSKRIILLSVIQFLSFPLLAFSSTVLSDLKIPAQIGNIKEVFEANAGAATNPVTVIQIQDAHCNYEAQKNLAQILEYLITAKNLRLIMVEGGSGDVSLSFLRGYADKQAREEIADKYLRKGKISGEEYLDIVSDHRIELYGVEDQSLYEANLGAFLDQENYREQGLKDIEALKQVEAQLAANIYNRELKDFEAKKSAYEQKSLTLSEYCKFLDDISVKKNIDMKEAAHLAAFLESARMEAKLDFKQVETERNIFIKELAKLLDKAKVQELIAKSQEFKAQSMSARDYYSYLQDTAKGRIDLSASYPQLASYITYIKVSKDINVAELIGEIAGLEDKVRKALFVNNDERELNRIAKALDALEAFLKLNLTPQLYEEFKRDKPNYTTASWINFLADNCRRYGLAVRPQASQAVDQNIDKLEDFYKLGLDREQAFINNLEYKLSDSGEKLVVLITGGFHTPGVTSLLKKKGYSYAVVAPVITEKGDSSLYFSVLRQEKEKLPDYSQLDSD
jgi:hypothetical protein